MKCECKELVECRALLLFIINMNRNSYSRTEKIEKRDSYSRTERVFCIISHGTNIMMSEIKFNKRKLL